MPLIPDKSIDRPLQDLTTSSRDAGITRYLFRGVLAITVIDFLAKAVSFYEDILAASYFGASVEMDTYLAAATLPTIVAQVTASAMIAALLPALTANTRQERADQSQLANAVMFVFLLATMLLAVAGIWAAPSLMGVLAPGLDVALTPLFVQLFAMLFLATVLQTGATVLRVELQVDKKFGATSMGNLLYWLVIILGIVLLASRWGVAAIAAGVIFGTLASFLFQLLLAQRAGFRLRLTPKVWRVRGVKAILLLSVPILVGESTIQLTTIVDRALASSFGVGNITALYYANKVVLLPHTLFAVALGTVLFPLFSETSMLSDQTKFANLVQQGIRFAAYVQIPLAICLAVFSLPLIQLLFQRGAFTEKDVAATAAILAIYSLRLFPLAVTSLLIYGFYSKRDTVTPMVVGVIAVVARIGLSVWLAYQVSWLGIAWATSITTIGSTLVLLYLLDRQTQTPILGALVAPLSKIVAASLGAALVALGLYLLLSSLGELYDTLFYQFVALLVPLAVAVPVYLVLTYVFRLEETASLLSKVRQWFHIAASRRKKSNAPWR